MGRMNLCQYRRRSWTCLSYDRSLHTPRIYPVWGVGGANSPRSQGCRRGHSRPPLPHYPRVRGRSTPPQGARLTLPRVLAGALHSFPSSFHALSWQLSFPQPYGARDILGLAAICTGRRRGHCRAAAAFGGPTWFPGTSQIASARTTGTILPSPCPMPMPLLVPLLLPPYSGRQGAGMAGNTIVLSMPPLSRLVAFWHEHTS